MIYLGFLFDYLVMLFLPVNTFFVVNDIDRNRLLSVVFIGILLDVVYQKILFNLIILLGLYFAFKLIKFDFKKKLAKNIIIYLIYFNVMYFSFGHNSNYLISFLGGLILQIIYMKLSKVLLN